MIIGIVAVDKQGAIGKGGKLPWHYPADMKFFRETTMGNACVMGSRTWKGLKQPLKKRLNIVLSRQGDAGLLQSSVGTSNVETARLNSGAVSWNVDAAPPGSGAASRNVDTGLLDGVIVLRDLEPVLCLNRYLNCDLFVMGGEKVYESFLPYIERWIVTEVPLVVEDADAFIPRDYLGDFVKARSLPLDPDLVVSIYDRLGEATG